MEGASETPTEMASDSDHPSGQNQWLEELNVLRTECERNRNAIIDLMGELDRERQTVSFLQRQHNSMIDQLDALQLFQTRIEEYEDLKRACVFSARLTHTESLSYKPAIFKALNTCQHVIKTSPFFDHISGKFTAPVDGDYLIDTALRQGDQRGSLDLALNSTKEFKAMFLGRTKDGGGTCNRSLVLSLTKGDEVTAHVRRSTASPDMLWCILSGFLISTRDN